MKLKQLLLKQSKPRIWLGGVRDMIQRSQTYYSIFNVILLLITTYTVREVTIKTYLPWFNFWHLIAVIFVIIILIILLDHKLIYPSQIAFHQHEAWKHESPVRKEFKKINERLDRIEKLLEGR